MYVCIRPHRPQLVSSLQEIHKTKSCLMGMILIAADAKIGRKLLQTTQFSFRRHTYVHTFAYIFVAHHQEHVGTTVLGMRQFY